MFKHAFALDAGHSAPNDQKPRRVSAYRQHSVSIQEPTILPQLSGDDHDKTRCGR